MRDLTARSNRRKVNKQIHDDISESIRGKFANDKPSKEAEEAFRRPPYYNTSMYKDKVNKKER